jgi:serine/threonine-protein kinase
MLLPDGTIKLIDFMVAQAESDTATATVVGKHAYLPPEQFRGAAVPRSDIYAYGCTLHYLLTGVEPEPLTESHPILLNYAVSAEMDTFVAKCTAQNLTDRYIDAQEIVAILESAAQEPATP